MFSFSVGYPVITLGFSFKSCISHRFRLVRWNIFIMQFFCLFTVILCSSYDLILQIDWIDCDCSWHIFVVWLVFSIAEFCECILWKTLRKKSGEHGREPNNFFVVVALQRKQLDVQRENDFHMRLLQDALPLTDSASINDKLKG